MSLWRNIFDWGKAAATSDQAKQAELEAVHAGMDQVSSLLKDKVPDFYQPLIQPLLGQIASHAVSAIMSKVSDKPSS